MGDNDLQKFPPHIESFSILEVVGLQREGEGGREGGRE